MLRNHGREMLLLFFLLSNHFFFKCFHDCRERRSKEGDKVKHDKALISQTTLFKHILKKQHLHFLVFGHFSWSMFGLRLVYT